MEMGIKLNIIIALFISIFLFNSVYAVLINDPSIPLVKTESKSNGTINYYNVSGSNLTNVSQLINDNNYYNYTTLPNNFDMLYVKEIIGHDTNIINLERFFNMGIARGFGFSDPGDTAIDSYLEGGINSVSLSVHDDSTGLDYGVISRDSNAINYFNGMIYANQNNIKNLNGSNWTFGGYQTPWTSNIDGNNYALNNVSSLKVNGTTIINQYGVNTNNYNSFGGEPLAQFLTGLGIWSMNGLLTTDWINSSTDGLKVLDANNRQLIGDDGSSVAINWSTGRLVGDGSGLTNLTLNTTNLCLSNGTGCPSENAILVHNETLQNLNMTGNLTSTGYIYLNNSATPSIYFGSNAHLAKNDLNARIYAGQDVGYGGGNALYIVGNTNDPRIYIGDPTSTNTELNFAYTRYITNMPGLKLKLSPSDNIMSTSNVAWIRSDSGDLYLGSGSNNGFIASPDGAGANNAFWFKSNDNATKSGANSRLVQYIFDTGYNASQWYAGSDYIKWKVAGVTIANMSADGGLKINYTIATNYKSSDGTNGITINGTTCAITEIKNGLITGGSCV